MSSKITEFVGIYDADSTIVGELSYWFQARLGRTHCALCDITHGLFTKKRSWQDCQEQLPVPFRTFHRNDAPHDVLDAINGTFPVVVARTSEGLSIAVTPHELEKFNGDPITFVKHLHTFFE